MTKLRVHNFSYSLDGFATGEGLSLEEPFGHAGRRLHEWFFPTQCFQSMNGQHGGSEGIDNKLALRTNDGIGAEIMGRGKFGPQEGPWDDLSWEGWWGENPPFHTPVFVMTNFPRPSIEMEGGTTFHFVTGTPASVLEQAVEAAGGLDVRLGGGPATVRQFLAADLVDFLHLVEVPIVLGRGGNLWHGLEGVESRFEQEAIASPSGVVHRLWTRKDESVH
jgi:dihydrofolate reductase